ncbi:MAG: hypothetical protein RLN75_01470, partial [Longimicrobiales bacterium]
YGLVAGLLIQNPAVRSARDQLDLSRTAPPGAVAWEVDVRYLTALGSDVVPLLVRRLDELPTEARCLVAERLVDRWGPRRGADWRVWTRADAAARDAVAEALPRLEAARGADDACGR